MNTATIKTVDRTATVEVVATLADSEVVTTGFDKKGHARRYRPDRLDLRWLNGELDRAFVSGPRVGVDGKPWTKGTRTGRSFMAESKAETKDGHWVITYPHALSDDAPGWVQALVEAHQPRP